MSLRILLQEHPRVIVLASECHALIFRHSPSSINTAVDGALEAANNQSSVPKCVVEFTTLEAVDLSGYRLLRDSGIYGTLGLINIDADNFLCVISAAVKVASVRPDENVQKILSVEFYCLNRAAFDHQLTEDISQYQASHNSSDDMYGHGLDTHETAMDHPCLELRKMLSGGTFYYSTDFDLTNRLQDRLSEGSAFDIDSLDEEFLWNAYMIDPLIKFRSRLSQNEKVALDHSRMLTSAIRGFVMTITIAAAASPLKSLKSNYPSSLTVLSRLSCRRAGTRFNSRGIDDDGYVANFVESEVVLWHPSGLCFSHVQVRGSVPIFWEQMTGLLPNQQKIQITRSPEATQSAFDKHFDHLELAYGAVHILNLMSATKSGEVELTMRYQQHVQRSPLNQTTGSIGVTGNRLMTSQFDFHAETKGPGGYEAASMVRRLIQDKADSFAYLLCDITDKSRTTDMDIRSNGPSRQESTVILQQEGIFRTNCLDCLDRTNLIQTIISQMALELFLGHRSERAPADFWVRHASLWADNGDALSKIYAGTGALKSSFTRHGKMSLAGAIADARKSATRLYINNFADKGRQITIDMLLGSLVEQRPVHLYDPINDHVASELQERTHEFSTSETICIWAGTFNLNGKGSGVREDLSAWLCPSAGVEPDIVAVGFQEIVELSPQQVMSTDPVRRQEWEEAVRLTINKKKKCASRDEYVLLRSGQLVGAALVVFVKSSALKNIKNVEGSVKKTGMSGMAGNKGAVAIRMDYANTRICLVTAHFAAGFANYEERNRDYRTISHGLRFQRNRSIDDHDAIIWLGDMNYRIGLSDDKARRLIKVNDLESLYANDQLNLQMIAGHVFPYYSEAQITFLPTYKYNNGTDEYDTSEKARIPAWCDRILRKGSNLKQIDYATAPLRFSDHRPVYATFECLISNVDENRKADLSRALYEKWKQNIAGSSAAIEQIDEDTVGYSPVAAELPPASSGRRKWWLDNGLPVRSQARPPTDMVLNLARPSNPFAPTKEPDWVIAGRSSEASKSTSRLSPARHGTQMTVSPNAPPESSSNASFLFPRHGDSPHQAFPSPSSPLSGSDVARKPAPPVPRKPALLSTSRAEPKGPWSRISASAQMRASNDHRVEGSSFDSRPNAVFSSQLPPPSTPDARGTPLNRGKTGTVVSRTILDEAGEVLEAIPSLQPVRRG